MSLCDLANRDPLSNGSRKSLSSQLNFAIFKEIVACNETLVTRLPFNSFVSKFEIGIFALEICNLKKLIFIGFFHDETICAARTKFDQ